MPKIKPYYRFWQFFAPFRNFSPCFSARPLNPGEGGFFYFRGTQHYVFFSSIAPLASGISHCLCFFQRYFLRVVHTATTGTAVVFTAALRNPHIYHRFFCWSCWSRLRRWGGRGCRGGSRRWLWRRCGLGSRCGRRNRLAYNFNSSSAAGRGGGCGQSAIRVWVDQVPNHSNHQQRADYIHPYPPLFLLYGLSLDWSGRLLFHGTFLVSLIFYIPACVTPYWACSAVKPSNSNWSIRSWREKSE